MHVCVCMRERERERERECVRVGGDIGPRNRRRKLTMLEGVSVSAWSPLGPRDMGSQ